MALASQNGTEPDVLATLPYGPPIIDGGLGNDSIERDFPFGTRRYLHLLLLARILLHSRTRRPACLLVCPDGVLRVENFHSFTLFGIFTFGAFERRILTRR
jgi:hypothetical protein